MNSSGIFVELSIPSPEVYGTGFKEEGRKRY
jgi:hypothetical protein